MGFMPDTAKAYGLEDPSNLSESADAAANMWSDLLRNRHGDLRTAAADYNWGSGNVDKYTLGKAPEETRKYMDDIGSLQSGATVNQNVTINVSGVTDSREAAEEVAKQQQHVNANLIRNMKAKAR